MRFIFFVCLCAISGFPCSGQPKPQKRLTPIMGWSSWNNFRVNISEQLIKKQTDAMISSGLKDAGYEYINIDDGYFGGRDSKGYILHHPTRFPNGMKKLADYIHAKGLKAGIYSDAGINTCASIWDKDTIGTGMGLWGHEEQDLKLMLDNWGYDFIKVDWCGGEKLQLDEETSYTRISHIIKEIKPEAVFNVCRWQFPGKWVSNIADSWRISGDIDNTFQSILNIIDLNADLWSYAGPGHVNDMDMLQVGRGMSLEEDKTHFAMWCMMASPLLAGNDLCTMSKQTIDILTNKDLIAIDQDPLVYQARRIKDMGDIEIWARPLENTMSGKVAVALLNRSKKQTDITFSVNEIGIDNKKKYSVRNVWDNENVDYKSTPELTYNVTPHGTIVLILSGEAVPFNVFQTK